jgi:hypothetical protein
MPYEKSAAPRPVSPPQLSGSIWAIRYGRRKGTWCQPHDAIQSDQRSP